MLDFHCFIKKYIIQINKQFLAKLPKFPLSKNGCTVHVCGFIVSSVCKLIPTPLTGQLSICEDPYSLTYVVDWKEI